MFGRLQERHCFSRWERQTAPFIQSQKTRNNLQYKKDMAQKVFDARPDARRRRIRRGFVYSRLLQLRRSDGRSRFPHDGVSRSLGEVACCSQQNDQLLSGTWLQQKQNALGRCIRAWSSAHGRYVNVGSRTRTRLHKTGHQQNSNGFSRHYGPSA